MYIYQYDSNFINMCISIAIYYKNKDENVHRFALSVIRGWLLEREKEKDRVKERDRERDRERDSFGILYTVYLLSIEKREEREREIKISS